MSPEALSPIVARVFDEDGPLARAVPQYEPRPGQRDMALAVAEVLEQGGRILVEAGTGTGKTLAYLVPAVLSRQRVLVSTGTKNLQEQIYFKDLPILAEALGVRFTATYMKGRANYLCLDRLDKMRDLLEVSKPQDPEVRNSRPRHSRTDLRTVGPSDPWLAMIFEWAARTETGDRAELGDLPDDLALWNDLSATSESCLGSTCPHYGDCFVTRMRQRAAESDVVIVNHHLLCADAAIRQDEYGEVIPACAHAVIDEAHQLEDVATQYFGIAVSNYRVEDLCHDAEQVMGAAREAIEIEFTRHQAIDGLRERARTFFAALQFSRLSATAQGWDGAAVPGGEDRVRLTPALVAAFADAGQEMLGALELTEQVFYSVQAGRSAAEDTDDQTGRRASAGERRSAPGRVDALAIARRAGEIREHLRFLLRATDPDFVYYLEMRGRGVFLRASPIEVSEILRSQLLDRFQAVVLTSATLSVGGSFEYMRGRLGAAPATELRLPSEFDYGRQALVYLPPRMPDPRSPAFRDAAASQIVRILERSRGRAFVLFTSYAMLRAVQPVVERDVAFPILVQGNASRSLLLQQFRSTPNAVLLATSSFWQGVDVVGEALSCVIVDKLPFASPGDPVTSARMEAITRKGGEPFWEYQVPLAILTLQQGLGRLIRHRRDRGVLSILDPRLRTKAYGQAFLDSLPHAPVTSSLDAIDRFFGD